MVRLDSEIADEVAWNGFIEHGDLSVRGVELIQRRRSQGAGRFTQDDSIRRVKLVLDLEPDTRTAGRVRDVLNALRGSGDRRLRLASVVGLRGYGDDDFDEERLIVVQDGRERSYQCHAGMACLRLRPRGRSPR